MPGDGVNQLVSGGWGRQLRPRWKQRCHFPQREKAQKDNRCVFSLQGVGPHCCRRGPACTLYWNRFCIVIWGCYCQMIDLSKNESTYCQ